MRDRNTSLVSHDILAVSSLEDEREGITRVIEALECHQWRSMVRKEQLPINKKSESRRQSEETTLECKVNDISDVMDEVIRFHFC